jgi:hypothetical protein
MGKCLTSSKKAGSFSGELSVCSNCIRKKPEEALEIAKQVHAKARVVEEVENSTNS